MILRNPSVTESQLAEIVPWKIPNLRPLVAVYSPVNNLRQAGVSRIRNL